ncbi:MAG: LysM peptidoglycan-binding domain-containing protein [Candidatus Nanopelagicus sp.]
MKARQAKRLARSVSTLSLLVVIGAGFSTISAASDERANTASVKSNYVQVVVTPGETLWSIAQLVADGGNVSEVVAQIVEINQLHSADVSAGTKLLVPAL